MLINFAHDGLLSIDCDCLQFDGHGVKNLIDVNKSRRTKGFLADRFIKPPTNISLLFKCNVDISKIVLNPRVGSQKSAGFEVLKVFRNKSTVSIAQAVIKEGTEVVLFCRSDEPGTSGAVRFCSDRAADRVRELKLRIFKTSGSTVPALGGLDVWGKPSQNVPDTIKNEVISTWKSICLPKVEKPDTKIVELEETQKPAFSLNPDIVVPEEFIDPISCEIMTIPMTLPSGNIVDVSTLDKFNAAQAKLGRPPCDPFTGVLFSENLKPVVAASLKSRLDKFLLDNSEAPTIKTLPRTLGRKSSSSASSNQSNSYLNTSSNAKRTSFGWERSNIQTVDDLLVDCLHGLPSYVDGSAPQAKKAKVRCAKCSKPASPGGNEYFFILPCQDIVCRECLCSMKKLDEKQCTECREQFEFSAVVRHHI